MSNIIIKTPEQIEGIRKSCRLASQALDYIAPFVVEGATTESLDAKLETFITEHGAIPAPKGYKVGDLVYPKATCISLNEVVCHGIPSARTLKDGDILNIDVTTILDGYYGDTSRMFMVGKVSKKAKKLVDVTKQALKWGIDAVKPGNHFGDIGAAIARFVVPRGYGIVDSFCGHGVGVEFHEDPLILHIAKGGTGEVIRPGMIFTVEPMLNLGRKEVVIDKYDGWTVTTQDNSLSAQWEHTMLVTENGCEILTVS